MIEVTCAIITDKSKILATRRSASMPHPHKWEFPGGKVHSGESPEKCIRREIYEELGIEIRVEKLLPSIIHVYLESHIKLIPFICEITGGEINLKEHSEFKWIDIDEIRILDWLEADLKLVDHLESNFQSAV